MARTPYIFPFQGIRIENTIHFEGQILHISDSGNIANPNDSLWKNLRRTFQLYTPTIIKKKHRVLKIKFKHRTIETPIDKYGYFHLVIDVDSEILGQLSRVEFFLGEQKIFINKEAGTSSIMIKREDFKIGIISDIDDTIIVSHSTNNIKKTALVGLKNAFSRKIVDETKELYEYLDSKICQFFYVSNSETNLYLLIKWILRLNGLPDGPIYLKDIRNYRSIFRNKKNRSFEEKYNHKLNRIDILLNYFPSKQFILIGDNSQGDPEIYEIISKKYPERIKAIFIRDISNKKRKEQLKKTISSLTKLKIPFFCYSDKVAIQKAIKEIDF
jgi:phosphatidate phosphatase APP1